jgi:hypothetical protein
VQSRYVSTVAIALFFMTTIAFILIETGEPAEPAKSDQPPIERVSPFPATNDSEVARIYATAAIVQAYLQNRTTPIEDRSSLVSLTQSIKAALK